MFNFGSNAWRKSPKKRRNSLKMAVLTKKTKIFIKARLTVSKSYLLGLVCFMIFCILRGDLIQITKYLCNLSITLNIFLPLLNLYDACSYGCTCKRVFFNEYFSSKIYSVTYLVNDKNSKLIWCTCAKLILCIWSKLMLLLKSDLIWFKLI